MPEAFYGNVIICYLKGTKQETAGSVIDLLRIWIMEFQPSGVLLLETGIPSLLPKFLVSLCAVIL
jgi:hypothetical protein